MVRRTSKPPLCSSSARRCSLMRFLSSTSKGTKRTPSPRFSASFSWYEQHHRGVGGELLVEGHRDVAQGEAPPRLRHRHLRAEARVRGLSLGLGRPRLCGLGAGRGGRGPARDDEAHRQHSAQHGGQAGRPQGHPASGPAPAGRTGAGDGALPGGGTGGTGGTSAGGGASAPCASGARGASGNADAATAAGAAGAAGGGVAGVVGAPGAPRWRAPAGPGAVTPSAALRAAMGLSVRTEGPGVARRREAGAGDVGVATGATRGHRSGDRFRLGLRPGSPGFGSGRASAFVSAPAAPPRRGQVLKAAVRHRCSCWPVVRGAGEPEAKQRWSCVGRE